MKNVLNYGIVVLVSSMVTGCFFAPQPEITYCDFKAPMLMFSKLELNHPVEVGTIILDAPSKIQLRMPDDTVAFDDNMRWAHAPAQLVKNYMTVAFAQITPKNPSPAFMKAPPYTIRMSFSAFEYNMKKRCAEVCVEWSILDNEHKTHGLPSTIYRSNAILRSNEQPEGEIDVSQAMADIMQRLARLVAESIVNPNNA